MPQSLNILLIMADQLAPFRTGAYEHPVVRMPHLDRLVERGVRCDTALLPTDERTVFSEYQVE